MNYLDSSALLKLLFEERESAELERWLADRASTHAVTSELAKVEVVRATRRLAPEVVPAARRLVTQLDLIPMSSDIVGSAADIGGVLLRSPDAIHLASAVSLGSALTTVVTYDARLAAAAADTGLVVARPGA